MLKPEVIPVQTVSFVSVDADHAGQRIDNYLLNLLKGVPRSVIYRILRSGEVRVNKGRIKPGYRLVANDLLRIPPVRRADIEDTALASVTQLEVIEESILFEDENLIILNKPAGMAAHAGSRIRHGVIELLRQSRAKSQTLELVHRLDRDTSGCLIVAKRREVLLALNRMLQEGGMQKHYIALLCGAWHGGMRDVSLPLERRNNSASTDKVIVSENGKSSITRITPGRRFTDFCRVDIDLQTGRMHQIRVHTAHIGHPVAGDNKYGDFKLNSRLHDMGLRRMFLHAGHVAFQLPGTQRDYQVSAPLDEQLQRFLDYLERLEAGAAVIESDSVIRQK